MDHRPCPSSVSARLACDTYDQHSGFTHNWFRPFAFPFVTRRSLLYCTAFGRDRALMHLVNETNGEEHEGESASRLIPRLERRKVTINRNNLIKDAQQTMTQLGSSK